MATDTLTPPTAPASDEAPQVPIVRISPDNATVLANLGLLQELAGTWRGHGFNLIGRPDGQNKQNVYLQLNQTQESLKIDPIGSSIPNRGFGQKDIELFGLTYLQKINDIFTGGALHIEPGIWITQPNITFPPESAPPGAQLIARMASIPHGNAFLAQGIAQKFSGPPTLQTAQAPYAFSLFPSFNSTPFAIPPTAPAAINAPGTSEKLNAAAAVPPVPPFTPYDLTIPDSATNPRTPFGTSPANPPLPASINGVPMQTVLDDPITLLQQVIDQQVAQGYEFEGTVLNISTQATLSFHENPNDPTGPTVSVSPQNGAGGIENILFLEGVNPVAAPGANADTATVYATFWIEKVMKKGHPHFLQLQYAQMVVLNFPILNAPTFVNIGWPHISVATLTKSFN
jgi:hypothetical protein